MARKSFIERLQSVVNAANDEIYKHLKDGDEPQWLPDAPELLFNSPMNGYVCYIPRAYFAGSLYCMDAVPEDWEDLRKNYNAVMSIDDLDPEGLIDFTVYFRKNSKALTLYKRLNNDLNALFESLPSRFELVKPVKVEHDADGPDWMDEDEVCVIRNTVTLLKEDGYGCALLTDLTPQSQCLLADTVEATLKQKPLHTTTIKLYFSKEVTITNYGDPTSKEADRAEAIEMARLFMDDGAIGSFLTDAKFEYSEIVESNAPDSF